MSNHSLKYRVGILNPTAEQVQHIIDLALERDIPLGSLKIDNKSFPHVY
jgi:hypothetical protein